jgi:hypothetical protein
VSEWISITGKNGITSNFKKNSIILIGYDKNTGILSLCFTTCTSTIDNIDEEEYERILNMITKKKRFWEF